MNMEYDWLSEQFNRPPYLLYRYSLVLSLGIIATAEFFGMKNLWFCVKFYNFQQIDIHIDGDISMSITFILLPLGCNGLI